MVDTPKRVCGTCNLCCVLVPVADSGGMPDENGKPMMALHKPSGSSCIHLNPKAGCRVYQRRPYGCRWWSCAWLLDPTFPEELRPDRCHVVIDMMPDQIIVDGKPETIVQMWIDTAHPEAWKSDEVMSAMEYFATRGMATLVRYNNEHATYVKPPPLTGDGKWYVQESNQASTRAEFIDKLATVRAKERAAGNEEEAARS